MAAPITVNQSTTLVQIDTSVLQPYIVYLSSLNTPGSLITIRDITGSASPTNPITVSTTIGVNFLNGENRFLITQPYGFVTVTPKTTSIWGVLNSFAFPDASTAANIDYLTASTITVNNSYLNRAIISTGLISTLCTTNLFVEKNLSVGQSTIGHAGFFTCTVRALHDMFTGGTLYAGSTVSSIAANITSSLTVPFISTQNIDIYGVIRSASTISTMGPLFVGSSISTTGNLAVGGSTFVQGELRVLENVIFYSSLSTLYSLGVGRETSLFSTLSVKDSIYTASHLSTASNLNVGGALSVMKSAFFTDQVSTQSNLTVGGALSVMSSFYTDGDALLNSSLRVRAAVSTLSNVYIASSLSVGGDLAVYGNIIFNDRVLDLNNLDVYQNLFVANMISTPSSIVAGQFLRIMGSTFLFGPVSTLSNVDVGGGISTMKDLSVLGIGYFASNLTVQSSFSTVGNVSVRGTISTLSSLAVGQDLAVLRNVMIGSSLSTLGSAAFFSSLQIQGSLSVFSSIAVSCNLNVGGQLTASSFIVAGSTIISTLAVTNTVGFGLNLSTSTLHFGLFSTLGALDIGGKFSTTNSLIVGSTIDSQFINVQRNLSTTGNVGVGNSVFVLSNLQTGLSTVVGGGLHVTNQARFLNSVRARDILVDNGSALYGATTMWGATTVQNSFTALGGVVASDQATPGVQNHFSNDTYMSSLKTSSIITYGFQSTFGQAAFFSSLQIQGSLSVFSSVGIACNATIGGALAVANIATLQSTLFVPDIFNSSLQTSSILASTVTARYVSSAAFYGISTTLQSNLFVPNIFNSSLQTSSVLTSTVTSSNVYAKGILATSTTLETNLFVPTIYNSTLFTSSVLTSTVTSSNVYTKGILATSTTLETNLFVPTIYNSTLFTSSVTASTLTSSNVYTKGILATSTTLETNLFVPTIYNSTLFTSSITASTLTSSNVYTKGILATSTTLERNLFVPNIYNSSLQTSSILTSTMTAFSTSLTVADISTLNLGVRTRYTLAAAASGSIRRIPEYYGNPTTATQTILSAITALKTNERVIVAAGTASSGLGIIYSLDGITWTQATGVTLTSVIDLVWTGTQFSAIGGTTFIRSFDGITWSTVTLSSSDITTLTSMAWNGFYYVLTTATKVYAYYPSTQTITITGVATLFTSIYRSFWTGSTWLIGGDGSYKLVSFNGTSVTQLNYTTDVVKAFATDGKIILLAGGGTLAYSTDGINWINQNPLYGASSINDLIWDGANFLAFTNGNFKMAISEDGLNWNGISPISSFPVLHRGVAYKYSPFVKQVINGQLAADSISTTGFVTVADYLRVGQSTLLVQDSTRSLGVNCNSPSYSVDVNGIINAKFIYQDGVPYQPPPTTGAVTIVNLATSTLTVGTSATIVNTSAPNLILIAGQGNTTQKLYTGTSPTTMTRNDSSFTGSPVAFNSAFYTGSRWYLAGKGAAAVLYTSPNAVTWTQIILSGTFPNTLFNKIVSNGSYYLLLGQDSTAVAPASAVRSIINTRDFITFNGSSSTTGSLSFASSANAAAWNGTLWVAVGIDVSVSIPTYMGPTIKYSYDGINWNPCLNAFGSATSSISAAGNTVVWNGTLFVAGGTDSTDSCLRYSYDGIVWYNCRGAFTSTTTVRTVVWSGKRFVAIQLVFASSNSILYSDDGINWFTAPQSLTAASSLIWTGSQFIVGASRILYVSTDGIYWTQQEAPSPTFDADLFINSLEYSFNTTADLTIGNTKVYTKQQPQTQGAASSINTLLTMSNALAINGLYADTSGKVGVNMTNPQVALDINGFARLNNSGVPNVWLCVGNAGATTNVAVGYYVSINNGNTWTLAYNASQHTPVTPTIYKAICWDGKRWLAMPNGSIVLVSSSGFNWSTISSSGLTNFTYANCLIWTGTYYIAVGAHTGSANIVRSLDGITWTAITGFGAGGFGIEYNGSVLVATGADSTTVAARIKYSLDHGATWTNATGTTIGSSPGDGIAGRCVATNGRIWLVGFTAGILYSLDGKAYTLASTWTGACNSIAWNGRVFVAVGQDNTANIKYSYDGITWINATATFFTLYGENVSWNGSLFIAVGRTVETNGASQYKASPTGITWANMTPTGQPARDARAIMYSSNVYPDLQVENLGIYGKGQPSNTSTNTITLGPSTITLNNTLSIVGGRIGVNCNAPQNALDLVGSLNVRGTTITSDALLVCQDSPVKVSIYGDGAGGTVALISANYKSNNAVAPLQLNWAGGEVSCGANFVAGGSGTFASNLTIPGRIIATNTSISFGSNAGQTGQGINGIAIGAQAGQSNQTNNTVAIGVNSGQISQQTNSVAIGVQAGSNTQGANSVAIGIFSGATNQGSNAIAIGQSAGQTNQAANSIALNASNVALNPANPGLYAKPVRSNAGTYSLYYTDTTGELSYAPTAGGSVAGINSAGRVGINSAANGSNALLVTGTQSNTGNLFVAGVGNFASNLGVNILNTPVRFQVIGNQVTDTGYFIAAASDVFCSILSSNTYQVGTRTMMEIGSLNTGAGNFGNVYKFQYGYSNKTDGSGGNFIIQSVAIGAGYQTPGTILTPFTIAGTTGNVGLSCNAPAYTLDVNGSANVNTTLRVVGLATFGNTSNTGTLGVAGQATFVNTSNTGTLGVAGNITTRGNTLYFGGNNTSNLIRFYGTTSDGPGSYNNTVIGEYVYAGTESSELILFKGNDTDYVYGLDRVRVLASGGFQVDICANASWNEGGAPPAASISGALCVLPSGNVGIGCNAPAYTLDINGSGNVNTTLRVGNRVGIGAAPNASNALLVTGSQSNTGAVFFGGALTVTSAILTAGTAVAFGNNAGNTNQGVGSVAIGSAAGQTRQGDGAIAIGQNAGNIGQSAATGQSDLAIAIGSNAGRTFQGRSSVAIGNTAGQTNQSGGSVAIGDSAADSGQSLYAIAIGLITARTNQGQQAVAIGYGAANNTQGANAIAIGHATGSNFQASNSIAIGQFAGEIRQSTLSVAIGAFAGQSNQNSNSVAIGTNAGRDRQSYNSVAIGRFAGSNSQGDSSVAIGNTAGQTNQQYNAVAIGNDAGNSGQGDSTVAIGSSAGKTSQEYYAIAIGNNAGCNSQRHSAVAIGGSSGNTGQGSGAVAIGFAAGYNNQSAYSLATGYAAGETSQGVASVALGNRAGSLVQGEFSVAIGNYAGYTNQKSNSVALGSYAGTTNQGESAVAIGNYAGYSGQGTGAIAIGYLAGLGVQGGQGQYSIAIGYRASQGYYAQPASSIFLNASGSSFTPATSGFFVDPIRENGGPNSLMYNPTTKEISYTSGGGGGAIAGINSSGYIGINTPPAPPQSPYVLYVQGSQYNEGGNLILYGNGFAVDGGGVGRIGIGTFSPQAPLHITTLASVSISAGYQMVNDTVQPAGATNLFASIIAENAVWSKDRFVASSDQRIKKNIKSVADSLDIINKLNLVSFDYIDYTKSSVKHGLIAQEVKAVYPDATTIVKDFIPSVYKLATKYEKATNVTITSPIPHGFAVNNKIKLFINQDGKGDTSDFECNTAVLEVLSDTEFVVKPWDDFALGNDLLIYGKEVDDFLTIDKPLIGVLAAGACKILSEKVTSQAAEIARLQATVDAQAAEIASLKATVAAILDKYPI